MSIQERLDIIESQIRLHAPDRMVTLVAVSKYASIDQIAAAYQAGVRHFGENRVQDALEKMAAFPADRYPDLRWHLIGSLQTNKVNKTLGRFAIIQSIDSLRVAEAVSEANEKEGRLQPVLIQVNLSADLQRHGFSADVLTGSFPELMSLKGIAVRGLMALAPSDASLAGDQRMLKNVFGRLVGLREHLSGTYEISLPEISMGMSHDYIHALDSGATIIRIGNFLFKNE